MNLIVQPLLGMAIGPDMSGKAGTEGVGKGRFGCALLSQCKDNIILKSLNKFFLASCSLFSSLFFLFLPPNPPLPPSWGHISIQNVISFPGVFTSGLLVHFSKEMCVITFLAQGKT